MAEFVEASQGKVNKKFWRNMFKYHTQKRYGAGINIRVKDFPSALLELGDIKQLNIIFTDEIRIPDEFAKVKIEKMELYGTITTEGIARIKKLFTNTDLRINNELINSVSHSKPFNLILKE